jgi:4-hydroxy-tetrahydrodipicolinate synthase
MGVGRMNIELNGVFAAMITPRTSTGSLNEKVLAKWLNFLLSKGVRGFAINGATAEYCRTTKQEVRSILSACQDTAGKQARVLCGIGSTSVHESIELGKVALDSGVTGLLLPMPFFYRYEQEDLEEFSRTVARSLPAPILLYNLPQFSTGLDSATVISIIRDNPNVIGIKDSSGSLEIIRALTGMQLSSSRIVGSDHVLAEALGCNLCDGVVSGVAGVLPELVCALFDETPNGPRFQLLSSLLVELLKHIAGLPTPWAVKWIAESRGFAAATFSLPLSPRRSEQGKELQSWFTDWSSQLWATL